MAMPGKYCLLHLSWWLVACGCIQRSGGESQLSFYIDGKLEHPSGGEVVLSVMTEEGFVPVDTASISSEGTFIFEGSIQEPDIYRLSSSKENGLLLVIDAPRLHVRADARDLQKTYRVTGSDQSTLLKQLADDEEQYLDRVSSLEERFIAARNAGHGDSLLFLQEKYLALEKQYGERRKDFVREHAGSFVGSFALYTIIEEEADLAFVDSVLAVFNEEIPDSKYVKLINERQKATHSLAAGAVAPEITLSQPNGTPLTLSSLRGQYLLIDFWASWCRPCREENPKMVSLYERYSKRGFEILGVSLDESAEQWKGAIEKDKLPWRHVSDLKGGNSVVVQLYNVRAIPMTVLVDPEGKIISLNLRGDALEEKLEEVFGDGGPGRK